MAETLKNERARVLIDRLGEFVVVESISLERVVAEAPKRAEDVLKLATYTIEHRRDGKVSPVSHPESYGHALAWLEGAKVIVAMRKRKKSPTKKKPADEKKPEAPADAG